MVNTRAERPGASARQLRALQERDRNGFDVVALVLDGKSCAQDRMVIALGITITGEKVVLGFVLTAAENERECAAVLRSLVARGLRVSRGLLVVLDGAKGFRAAVTSVFGAQTPVNRCQWHKRENGCRLPAEGPAGSVAAEALGRLRAAHLRRGQGSCPAAPPRVGSGERVGRDESG